MKRKAQRNGNGSSKLIWLLQSVIAQSVSLENVSHSLLAGHLAPVLTQANEHTVLWLLFFLDGLGFIFLLSNFLGNLAVLLLVRFFPHFPHGAQWGVYIGFVVLAHILWYLIGTLVRAIPSNHDKPDFLS
jgi:hypothetical protein